MKKTLTFSIATLTVFTLSAQLPVSQVAGKKQVLIEEFTGNTCGYCPDGHKITDQIVAANPGKAFGINLHPTGISFTTPASASNSKDFRVPEAYDVLAVPGMLSATGQGSVGFPAGAINRMTPISPATPQNAGGLMMNRNFWAGMASTILTQNTYVNVAGQAYVHPTTRQMIVNMEAYYTSNSPVSSNRICIALVQDNILAYQSGGSSYYPAMVVGSDYKHQHALRTYINTGTPKSARGEVMTGANTAGTKWTKTFNYTVAQSFPVGVSTKSISAVLADLHIIAYIMETDKNVVAVCKVPITITTSTDIFGPAAIPSELVSNYSVYPNPMANEGAVLFTLAKESNVNISVVNALGQVVKTDKLEQLGVGEHKYELDATSLSNGIYFVNITVGEGTLTKKISVLK